jgi:hypothetical protein
MMAEDQRGAGDGREHRDEGEDQKRIGIRDDLGKAALEERGQGN